MGLNSRPNYPCPCCKPRNGSKGFQEIAHLRNAGLVIYWYASRTKDDTTSNTIADVFILHNINDVEITSDEIANEFDLNNVICPRCRNICEHAQRLIQKVTSIDKSNIVGICDHCKVIKDRFQSSCNECKDIVNKFIIGKGNRIENSKRVLMWLSNNKYSYNASKNTKSPTHEFFNDNFDENSPRLIREPEIMQIFYPTHQFDSTDSSFTNTASSSYSRKDNVANSFESKQRFTIEQDKTWLDITDHKTEAWKIKNLKEQLSRDVGLNLSNDSIPLTLRDDIRHAIRDGTEKALNPYSNIRKYDSEEIMKKSITGVENILKKDFSYFFPKDDILIAKRGKSSKVPIQYTNTDVLKAELRDKKKSGQQTINIGKINKKEIAEKINIPKKEENEGSEKILKRLANKQQENNKQVEKSFTVRNQNKSKLGTEYQLNSSNTKKGTNIEKDSSKKYKMISPTHDKSQDSKNALREKIISKSPTDDSRKQAKADQIQKVVKTNDRGDIQREKQDKIFKETIELKDHKKTNQKNDNTKEAKNEGDEKIRQRLANKEQENKKQVEKSFSVGNQNKSKLGTEYQLNSSNVKEGKNIEKDSSTKYKMVSPTHDKSQDSKHGLSEKNFSKSPKSDNRKQAKAEQIQKVEKTNDRGDIQREMHDNKIKETIELKDQKTSNRKDVKTEEEKKSAQQELKIKQELELTAKYIREAANKKAREEESSSKKNPKQSEKISKPNAKDDLLHRLIQLKHSNETNLSTTPSDILSNAEYNTKQDQANEIAEIIIGKSIFKYKPPLTKKKVEVEVKPLLFQSVFQDQNDMLGTDPEEFRLNPSSMRGKAPEQETSKGITRFALSDRTFIEKGWTVLPTEKVVRKMNVYRMRPAHPEFNWFESNKHKRLLQYDTGEKLADFTDSGRGSWFYRNGRLALDYYDAEEVNAQQRFVVYSSGEPDERGRSHPITILATFDYLGNGIVFDHGGKIRLKYNQTEGVVLDREIGPVSHWKWHNLNDPPVLQQVMIDTQMPHKDPEILKLGGPSDSKLRSDNEEMLEIEFDNFIREKSKKLSQTFKPFQIKMKALKINKHFSLRVLDQANVYLIFRDGLTNLKLNIGMVLDHQEIIDTDIAEVGKVSNNLERLPACTDSLAGLQRNIANAQRFERSRTEREYRRLRPSNPCRSADQLTAALSRPLNTVQSGSTTAAWNCKCYRKPLSNVYYDTSLI